MKGGTGTELDVMRGGDGEFTASEAVATFWLVRNAASDHSTSQFLRESLILIKTLFFLAEDDIHVGMNIDEKWIGGVAR